MSRSFIFFCAFALLPGIAMAQRLDVMTQGMGLGKVIGSEEYCGLSYSQSGIEGWIEANIPAEAMDFAQFLEMGIAAESYEQPNRTDSAKIAHCAAIRRTAAHYGFID